MPFARQVFDFACSDSRRDALNPAALEPVPTVYGLIGLVDGAVANSLHTRGQDILVWDSSSFHNAVDIIAR